MPNNDIIICEEVVKMIGIYNYTVILTYMSVASAITGMYLAFQGHPLWAVFCLMFSGLCDGFDGKVARTKKNRTKEEKAFGVQLDSLADMIAYGVLPVVIGITIGLTKWYYIPIFVVFTLGALIRLAHFNVLEEEVEIVKGQRLKSFIGLPTTSVCLILPAVFAFQEIAGSYFPVVYASALLVIASLFVIKLRFVDKPDLKKLIQWVIVGVLEAIIIILLVKLWNSG